MDRLFISLVKLQDLDLAVEAHSRAKAALAPRRAALQKDIAALQSAHEEAKKSLAQAQLDKKSLEGEVEAQEQKARKHTGELNSVKSNDAYKALLSEIEAAKKAKAGIEDRILELMEKTESLQRQLREREKTLAADRAALEARIAEVEAEEKRLDTQAASSVADRDSFRAGLPSDILGRYDQVRRGRPDFSPIAAVDPKAMTCGGCRQKLPPDVVNQALKGKELVSCDSCSRLLYVPASEPVPTPPVV
jgi:uncharacterized protein